MLCTQLHDVLTALPARANRRLAEKLRATGVAGARRYAAGQLLTVCVSGEWRDMEVVSAPSSARGEHCLRAIDTSTHTPLKELSRELTPWNHAPFQLPHADFEFVRGRYERAMQAQHASIVDALSGTRLDVLKQCMPIEVKEEATAAPQLADWQRSRRCKAWPCSCGVTSRSPCSRLGINVISRCESAQPKETPPHTQAVVGDGGGFASVWVLVGAHSAADRAYRLGRSEDSLTKMHAQGGASLVPRCLF